MIIHAHCCSGELCLLSRGLCESPSQSLLTAGFSPEHSLVSLGSAWIFSQQEFNRATVLQLCLLGL